MRKRPSCGSEKKFFVTEKATDLIACTSRVPNHLAKHKTNQIDGNGSACPKTKQSRIEVKAMDQCPDLISQLPEHIIHHILSFLHCKKDAARTSILSKRWRDVWFSYFILDFDERKFQNQDWKLHFYSNRLYRKIKKKNDMEVKRKSEVFRNFVDKTLQSHNEKKSVIRKFMLHLTSYDLELADHVDRWIDYAIKSNIQELDIYVPSKKTRCYHFPQSVFAATTITALRISGCKLGTCNDIKMFSLRKLWIGKIHIDEERIENFIVNCPLLEDLRLIHCSGLKTLLLSNNKIHRIDIHLCHALKKVEVLSPSLQKFWYHGKRSTHCKIDLAVCKSLKSLTLEDYYMKDDSFQNQLSSFPILEQLSLSKCCALQNITISSHLLKVLALRDCGQLKEADINTPNLLSFEYRGQKIPFSSLNPSPLREAKLYFEQPMLNYNDDFEFPFHELQNFLRKFDNSKGLKLVVRSKKNAIIHEDLREILVPRNFGLKLEVVKLSTSLEDILDNLLQTWHPETLSIVSSGTSNFPEQVHKKIVDRGEEPDCCKYKVSSNKCWRHFLMNVKAENLGDTEYKSDWVDWLKSSTDIVNQLSFFRLDWKQ
ncbi:hypothetical protein JCGZ_24814 [Jatropha curcas]|uniref:F-box domain-containing protein n=2 Tax=Jatropha curcas TaxID=180498 RepID=A0A067L8J6_JATCU|nr:F-box/FBD/LRR-repeat protein At5g53840 isoform X2 [Jatropha curcas]KDP40815.1 hypothetical protein JCGZ_24814 [Jatropha curcas]